MVVHAAPAVAAGAYDLLALSILEDRAGNQIGRAFEVDNFETVDKGPDPRTVTLPFHVISMTSRAFAARARAVLIGTIALVSTAHAQSVEQLRLIAPAAPGGGWDQTARVMQQALQREGIARLAPVENIPGAAGTIGLARFIGAERGRGDVLMVSGLIMLGGIVTHQSPVTLRDVVPIARLTGEYQSDCRAGRLAATFAAGSDCRVQGAAGIDLLGRRVGRRQR